jgi:hypothetical protein
MVARARQAALKAGIDPDQFLRQINQESGFRTDRVSPAGARGIAQIVPRYHPGVDADDPDAALDYAATLMAGYKRQYGRDDLALAAYNAGPGAVEQYGGVPPFRETQTYVRNILQAPSPVLTAGRDLLGKLVPSQFGDPSLSAEEAAAACGPAAAVAFARANGRNPTLREALDVAKQVGWTAQGGMNGVANQKRLLDTLGIPATLDTSRDWSKITQAVQGGAPVTISTPVHYFVADGYDPQSGRFHVGASGTAFKNGSDWLSADEIQSLGGGMNGALFTDARLSGELQAADFEHQVRTETGTPSQAQDDPLAWIGALRERLTETGRSFFENLGVANPLAPDQGGAETDEVAAAVGEPQAISPVPAPGFGYDPSALRPATAPETGVPLRQDVRDFNQPAQPTVFDQTSQALGLDPASRTARQAQIEANRPTSAGLAEDVGQAVLDRAAAERAAPGQLYQADVAAGEALAEVAIARAKDLGWQPDAETERSAHNVLATVTPSNVLLSALTAGSGSGLMQLVRGASTMVGAGVGGEAARRIAEQAGLSPELQAGASVVGSLAGGLAAPAAAERALRAVPSEVTTAASQLARTRQRAESEIGFAMGRPTGGEPTVPRPTGAPVTSEQLQSTLEGLGQQWQSLEREASALEDQAASAFNPGLQAQLRNRAAMLRQNQADVLRTVEYIDEHGALPIGVKPAEGLAESIPEPPLERPPVEPSAPSAPRSSGDVSATAILASPNYRRLQAMRGTAEQQAALRPAEAGFAGNLNLDKTITTDDVKQALVRNMEQQGGFAGQRRGVITDVQAQRNAAEKALTMSAQDWLKTRPGKAFNQEEALALGNQLVRSGNEYAAMRTALRAAEADGSATDLMRAAVADKALELALLEGVRSGATAEAGRTLRSFRQALTGALAGKDGDTSKAFRAALRAIGTDEDAYGAWVKAWDAIPEDDVVGRYALLQRLHQPSGLQKLLAFTTSNMLSGTKTLEVNAVGGALETLNRPVIELLGGRPIDAWTDLTAMGRAIGLAWGNAGTTLTTGIRPSRAAQVLADPTKYEGVRPEAFGGKKGLIATPALRAMSATDEFLRSLNAAGGLAVATRREARATGKTVQEILSQPPEHVLQFAQNAADAAVFEGQGSPFSKVIGNWRNLVHSSSRGEQAAGLVGHVLFPFVHIPEQILLRGGRMLPGVNEASTLWQIHKGLRSNDPQVVRDAIGRYILTDAVLLAAGSQVLAGNITGNGPRDPAKRAALDAARDEHGNKVWQAHSVRIGDRWVDYTNLGPVAIPLAALSNAHEAYLESGRKPGANEVLDVFNRVGETMLDASYIKSFGDLFRGISQGNLAKATGSLIGNTATRFVPAGGLAATLERSMDQEQKNPRNLAEYVASRVPIASEFVPDKLSPFGGTVQQPQDLLATLSPFKTSATGEPEPVAQAFADAGLGAPSAPSSIRLRSQATGASSPPIALTDDEKVEYVRLMGDRLAQLERTVNNPRWQQQPIASRQKSLQAAVQDAREYAEQQLYQRLSPEDRRQRMQEGERSLEPMPLGR